MRHSKRGRFQRQMNFLRRQFLQQRGLPLSDVLSEGVVAQALAAVKLRWTDRIYSPLVTLWVFLGQVLNADSSCRAAVARLIAHRLSQGQSPCSAETGAYCQARRRLPLSFFAQVACMVGRALDARVERHWLVPAVFKPTPPVVTLIWRSPAATLPSSSPPRLAERLRLGRNQNSKRSAQNACL